MSNSQPSTFLRIAAHTLPHKPFDCVGAIHNSMIPTYQNEIRNKLRLTALYAGSAGGCLFYNIRLNSHTSNSLELDANQIEAAAKVGFLTMKVMELTGKA